MASTYISELYKTVLNSKEYKLDLNLIYTSNFIYLHIQYFNSAEAWAMFP